MSKPVAMDLEDLVTAVYCALDDALKAAGICAKDGKLLGRRGSRSEVDDFVIDSHAYWPRQDKRDLLARQGISVDCQRPWKGFLTFFPALGCPKGGGRSE